MPTFLLTIASGVATWWMLDHYPCVDDPMLRSVVGAYASVAVTMLGFMLAMLAILVSVADRKLIRNMNKTGHFVRLLKQIYWAAGYYGAAMCVSLLALFMSGNLLDISGSAATSLMVGATMSLVITMRKLWLVLTLVNTPSTAPLE